MYAVVVCRPLYSTLRQNVHFVLLHDLKFRFSKKATKFETTSHMI